MKHTITLLAFLILNIGRSQVVADFENFSLPPDSFYYSSSSADWQTSDAYFNYEWTTSSFGDFWSAGFAYTNINDVDSGNYRHQYNCSAGKGYNLSNYYVTGQPGSFIRVKAPSTGVFGFYVTNSTYAYMSMKNGDSFAKKFGGPTGNDPDFFKLTVRGYSGGTIKPDSVEYYLADFRSSNNLLDYISKTWQWVDCNKLGAVDSITFYMYSSDNSFGFMNTPGFFCIDNLTTGQGVGIAEVSLFENFNLYPNPANDQLNIDFTSLNSTHVSLRIINSLGATIKNEAVDFNQGEIHHSINVNDLSSGLYMIEMTGNTKKQTYKFVKN
jgi:hypothetical protein